MLIDAHSNPNLFAAAARADNIVFALDYDGCLVNDSFEDELARGDDVIPYVMRCNEILFEFIARLCGANPHASLGVKGFSGRHDKEADGKHSFEYKTPTFAEVFNKVKEKLESDLRRPVDCAGDPYLPHIGGLPIYDCNKVISTFIYAQQLANAEPGKKHFLVIEEDTVENINAINNFFDAHKKVLPANVAICCCKHVASSRDNRLSEEASCDDRVIFGTGKIITDYAARLEEFSQCVEEQYNALINVYAFSDLDDSDKFAHKLCGTAPDSCWSWCGCFFRKGMENPNAISVSESARWIPDFRRGAASSLASAGGIEVPLLHAA